MILGKLSRFFQQLFSFSYTEARGFLVLLIICIVALILLYIPDLMFKDQMVATEEEIRQLDSLVQVLEGKNDDIGKKKLFNFNPNLISVDSLILLGVDKKITSRIHNYRNKGGVFYIKKDLKKNL